MSLQFNPFTGTFDVTTKGDTGAVAAAGDGTAAAPGITFASDTNTGIYRPGADQLALSTNGTGRLFIDASGRILAGTSTTRTDGLTSAVPVLIETRGGGANGDSANVVIATNFNGDRGSAISFIKSRADALSSNALVSSGDTLGSLNFVGTDGSIPIVGARIQAFVDGTASANDMPGRLVFSTTADGAASPTERLRITSAGLVGIGSSAPYVFTQIEGQLMATGSADQFASEQKVLIFGRKGRSSLDRHNYISSVVNFTSGNDNKLLFYVDNSSGTSHVNPLTLTGANRVGIGTQSPGVPLSVKTAGGDSAAIHVIARTAGSQSIVFRDSNDTANTAILYQDTNVLSLANVQNAPLSFATNNTERARITSSGQLLVGTSTSTNNANDDTRISVVKAGTDVYPNIRLTAYSGNNSGPAPVINFNRSKSTTDGGYTEVSLNDALGYLVFSGADGVGWSEAAYIAANADGDWTTSGDTTDSPGRLVFATTADGAASPTERMRIKANGTINFSNVSVYADNAAATAGGLAVGDVYRTSTGQLMIRY